MWKLPNTATSWLRETCAVTRATRDHISAIICSARVRPASPAACIVLLCSCCVGEKLWFVLSVFARVTLTCTHSFFVPRLVRAVVTVQSLVVVAGVGLVAHLAHLPGAGLAAVAAVHEEADARRAARRGGGTLARPLAVLRAVVQVHTWGGDGRGGRHGSGILGVGLRTRNSSSQV